MYHGTEALNNDVVYAGSISWRSDRNCYRVTFNRTLGIKIDKCFYGEAEESYERAKAYRREKSDEHGLTVTRKNVPIEFCQYLAGMIDGDGNISAYQRTKHRNDFPAVSLTQSQSLGTPEILLRMQTYYPENIFSREHGAINNRRVHGIKIHGPYAVWLLKDIQPHIILKKNQVDLALEMFDPNNKQRYTQMAVSLQQMTTHYHQLNFDGMENRVTFPYIAGFFDAEGCVQFTKSHGFEMAQCQCPQLLHLFKKVLVKDESLQVVTCGHFKLSGSNATDLFNKILPYVIGKKFQIETVLKMQTKRKRTISDAEFEEMQLALKRSKRI